MGTSLNGLTPAGTYPGLIKTGDNAPIDGTLKTLSDGNGNNLPMAVSTTAVNFTNQLQQSGVAVPTASQVAAKQDTLVSGTNIKTINGTSLLGSGNIPVVTSPSGVAGAIQFSNGSAFASDATNLFWDDTNNRLGVGTNAPSATGHFQSVGDQLLLTNSNDIYTYLKFSANGGFLSMIFGDGSGNINYLNNYAGGMWASNKFAFGPSYFTPSGQVHIKGSGSTSATTSLLVQNSAGSAALQVFDNGQIYMQQAGGTSLFLDRIKAFTAADISMPLFLVGVGTLSASAAVQINATDRGFLPPRMTTTQKNAIATPAAGLVVYDTTTNKLCCYNGSTWNDLF